MFPEEVRHPKLHEMYLARRKDTPELQKAPTEATFKTVEAIRHNLRDETRWKTLRLDSGFPTKSQWLTKSGTEKRTACLELFLRYEKLYAAGASSIFYRDGHPTFIRAVRDAEQLQVFLPVITEVDRPLSFDQGRSNRVVKAIRERLEYLVDLPRERPVRFVPVPVCRESGARPFPAQQRQQRQAENLTLAGRFTAAFPHLPWAAAVTGERLDRKGSAYAPENAGRDQGDQDLHNGLVAVRAAHPNEDLHLIMIWRGPDGFLAGPQYSYWARKKIDPNGLFRFSARKGALLYV